VRSQGWTPGFAVPKSAMIQKKPQCYFKKKSLFCYQNWRELGIWRQMYREHERDKEPLKVDRPLKRRQNLPHDHPTRNNSIPNFIHHLKEKGSVFDHGCRRWTICLRTNISEHALEIYTSIQDFYDFPGNMHDAATG
jgi:hypothetical protein